MIKSNSILIHKSSVRADNNDYLQNGTEWFCTEDNSMGLMYKDEIIEFGKIPFINGNIKGIIDRLEVVENISNIDTTNNTNKNVIYFIKNNKGIAFVSNNQIVFQTY